MHSVLVLDYRKFRLPRSSQPFAATALPSVSLTASSSRASFRSILRRWRELKGLREDQGYSSTPLRLSVRELPSDVDREAELWQRELRAELDELRAEHERSRQHRDTE